MAESNTEISTYTHLHLHTAYSALDGAIKIKPLIARLKELGMQACAITDHGSMYGVYDFYENFKKEGLKPIIGSEFYIAPDSRFNKKYLKGEDSSYHLVLLAENNEGLHNLFKLSSIGYLEGFYYKPRIDKEVLRKHSKGIIALSACLKGEVARKIIKKGYDEALNAAREYKEIFGRDNFFIEVQINGVEDQKIANAQLENIARELDLELVATCDAHYLRKEDFESHKVLMQMQMQSFKGTKSEMYESASSSFSDTSSGEEAISVQESSFATPKKKTMSYTDMLYVKSPEEVERDFINYPTAIENTKKIASRCNIEFDKSLHLPKYEVPAGFTTETYFRHIALEGLQKRLELVPKERHPEYMERFEMEMKVIIDKGFDGYYLIVWDFINYAHKNDIPVGVGRGSGAGSLVAYSLGITGIDPIKFGLYFERFLNPERKSMPDFDIDFCPEGREDVIRYVSEKYGVQRVSQIATFGMLKPKSIIRDVCRVYDIPLSFVDKLCKEVPADIKLDSFSKIYEAHPEFGKKFEEILPSHADEIKKHAENLDGLIRQTGKHAAGVIIGDKDLVEYTPLFLDKDGNVVAQFEKHACEEVGLVKFDFLGLINLTTIQKAERIIRATADKNFDIFKVPLDDAEVYNMLAKGLTAGVFQLESEGMRDLLKRLKPTCIDDIIAANALYRPGPMDSGMLESYVRRKNGLEEVTYPFPELEETLKETYGVIVYQEQVMKIAQILGGFSLGAADNLRRAMGKKKPEEMAANRKFFLYGDGKEIKGVEGMGFDMEKASKLYDNIDKFAGYAFNKSHSAAYGYIAYQTAYLKVKYPLQYMTALLSISIGKNSNTDIPKFITECKAMNIEILPPDINKGYYDFRIEGNAIRFGLGAIKGIGEKAIESFVLERKKNGDFKSFYDMCNRIDYDSVNKKTVEALIYAGALDFFGKTKKQLITIFEDAMAYGNKRAKDKQKGIGSIEDFFNMGSSEEEDITSNEDYPDVGEFPKKEILEREKEMLGFYLSGHPLMSLQPIYSTFATPINVVKQNILNNIKHNGDNKEKARVCGIIKKVRKTITKNNQDMAYIDIEDLEDTLNVILFPRFYEKYKKLIVEDNIIVISGTAEIKENSQADSEADSVEEKPVSFLLHCDQAISFEEALDLNNIILKLNFINERLTQKSMLKLKDLIIKHKGETPIKLAVCFEDGSQTIIKPDSKFQISANQLFIEELANIEGFSKLIAENEIS